MRIAPHLLSRFFFTAMLLPAAAFAATEATTDPVGFVTLSTGANPTPGTPGTYRQGLKAAGLFTMVEYQGSAETIGANTLSDDQATWTAGDFDPTTANKYYVEIASGPNEGVMLNIASSTRNGASGTITTAQPVPSGTAAGTTFKIRKLWTLRTLIGVPPAGNFTGGTSTTSDYLLIQNGSDYNTYYFHTASGTWRKTGSGATNFNDQEIQPDDGLIIQHRQGNAVGITVSGAAKTGKTSIPVFPGTNVVANPSAASMTLNQSNLRNTDPLTSVAAGTSTSADQVLVFDENTQDYLTYYFHQASSTWRQTGLGATNVGDTAQIPPGAAVVIVRKAASGFNWVVPQTF